MSHDSPRAMVSVSERASISHVAAFHENSTSCRHASAYLLAASANDNGLLHQEFVDFDVPEPLGWAAIPDEGAASRTNDMQRCLRPFQWAERDREAGLRAEARRHEQLRASLRSSAKFMLGPSEPCALRFGPNRSTSDAVGRFKACRVPRPRSPTSDAKACYAWCEGGMSQAYSAASLLQVRSIKATRGGGSRRHGSMALGRKRNANGV